MGDCVSTPNYVKCNRCQRMILSSQVRSHVCAEKSWKPRQKAETPQSKPYSEKQIYQWEQMILYPSPRNPPSPFSHPLYGTQVKQFPQDPLNVLLPIDKSQTKFQWIKEPTRYFPPQLIKSVKAEAMRTSTFQEKMLWFRLNMESFRVSWHNGCETMKINRGNLLMSSFDACSKIGNWHREVKIQFDDEDVEDAGGVIRQWMHLVLEEMFNPATGLFQLCDTEETAYKITWDHQIDQMYASEMIWLLGVVIGKALFERISIGCHLNKTLLRQVCWQRANLPDIFSFDEKLYEGWMSVLNEKEIQDLFLTFEEVKVHQDGKMEKINLKSNGSEIDVTNANKRQYIINLIDLYSFKSIEPYVNALKKGIYKVIPPHFMSVFQPHELENMLCGPSFINVQDWKQNTQYKGYHYNDTVVQWFWAVVSKFDQTQLKNLLHYCTGSNRVPVLGFKYLESNRNTVAKFTIEKVPHETANPYPKSYTCFNRLQLPQYPTFKELQKNMNIIVKQELNHFGLS